MPKLQKSVLPLNLDQYRVWVTDTDPTSRYFRLAQVPDVLTGGKNAFLINGSNELVSSTDVLVEIKDANGNPVFVQPIRNYVEGLARVVSIEVYEDTAPGPATLTILGQLRQDARGNLPPEEFRAAYNVKWTKNIFIAPFKPNTTPIRLYQRPTLDVREILSPYRNAIPGASASLSAGQITFVGQTNTISLTGAEFTRDMVSGTFSALIDGAPFSASVDRVQNSGVAILSKVPTGSNGTTPVNFSPTSYFLSYQLPTTFVTTELSRSFVDATVSKLTTFSGDIARAKLYVRSLDQPGDYQQVTDVSLEAMDLTMTQSLSTGEQNIRTGYFLNQTTIDTYWEAGTIEGARQYTVGGVSASYDSAVLLDAITISFPTASLALASTVPQYFVGLKKPLSCFTGLEYTFAANFTCQKDDPAVESRMDVYLFGQSFPSSSDDPLGVRVASFIVPAGLPGKVFTDYVTNIVAPRDGTSYLRFVVYSGKWYASNVSFKSARETGFNPDEIEILTPLVGRRFERLQFKVELLDANSNIVPIPIETAPIFFDGGNVVFKGEDHRIEGNVRIIASGSNPITAIQLKATGFNIGASFVSGSAISIGSGSWFNRNTPFLVASDVTGSPFISIADKLRGYVDPANGNFILDIEGDFLVGSGSNKFDVRTLLPRNYSDIFYDRVRGGQGDFEELRGRRAVTAGEWNGQIARMGLYTRGASGYLGPFSTNANAVSGSVNPFSTGSFTLATSGTITIPSDQSFYNQIIYADLNVGVNENALTAGVYGLGFNVGIATSWLGFPSLSGSFQTLVSVASAFVAEQGSYAPDPIVKYPIPIPQNRVGNTLYYVIRLQLNSNPS